MLQDKFPSINIFVIESRFQCFKFQTNWAPFWAYVTESPVHHQVVTVFTEERVYLSGFKNSTQTVCYMKY
jgi:hypothetical protein